MPQKQLTTAQIKELHKLVERNAIKYYDVEVEIVDHYASAIEEIWAEDPSISFYHAQMQVYKEFWDFKDLEKDKQQLLFANANKDCWKILKGMFGWPSILKLIVLSLLIYNTLYYTEHSLDWAYWNIALIYSLMFFPGYQYQLVRRFEKKTSHSFLRLYALLQTYSFYPIIILYICLHMIEVKAIWSFALCSVGLAMYILGVQAVHLLFKKEMLLLEKQYA